MKKIILGQGGKPFEEILKKHGFSPVILPSDESLPPFVNTHADMITVRIGEKLLFTRSYYEKNKDIISPLPIVITHEKYGNKYPYDILFNVLFTDTALYGNLPFVSEKIKEFANSHSLSPVAVKQGYTKCSVAKTKNGYITADEGLYRALTANGEKVLKITEGHFVLRGLSFGFIGGSSFYHDGMLYFFGDISLHPDGEKIKSFCRENQTEAVCLSDSMPADIGGAVLL